MYSRDEILQRMIRRLNFRKRREGNILRYFGNFFFFFLKISERFEAIYLEVKNSVISGINA